MIAEKSEFFPIYPQTQHVSFPPRHPSSRGVFVLSANLFVWRAYLFVSVQILKCIPTSSFQAAGTLSPMDHNIQLFPFGSEYSSTANKVPPLKQKRGGYDQKVDIWAIGCLLFELLTGMGRQHAAVLGSMQTL